MKNDRRSRRQRGTVLLLSLLVLSSIVIASSGLSSLILSSLQQTRIIDSSIVAYYAAESAAEEVIYVVRKTDLSSTWAEDLTVPAETPQQMDNGASWNRTVVGSEPVIYAAIPRDNLLEVALYDPDQENVSLASLADKVVVNWTYDPCVPEDDSCPKLMATLVRWAPGTETWEEDAAKTMRYVTGSGGVPPATIILDNPSYLHKLRLRAEDADLKEVGIRAYAGENAVDLPGRVRIDAWGRFGQTQQHLTVRLPRRTPLSGIYDFALFSECSLVKGYPISCP